MRRHYLAITLILTIGLALAGCKETEEEPVPLTPTAIPSTQVASPEPSPTETIIIPTSTSTPTPLPTSTPKTSIPEELAPLTYRTLGEVEELAAISLANVVDLDFSPDGRYLRMRVPAGEETHQDIFFDLEEKIDPWWKLTRTPLGLIQESENLFTVFFTAYNKDFYEIPDVWKINDDSAYDGYFASVGMMKLKLIR